MTTAGTRPTSPDGRPISAGTSVGNQTYKPEFAAMCRKACEVGFTNIELAKLFGVNIDTINSWRLKYPEFREAMVLGKKLPDDRVEAALYMRAIGFHYDTEKLFVIDGEVVRVPFREYVVPDSHACTRWLVNRRPEVWRDRNVNFGVFVAPGGLGDLSKLSEEELDKLETDELQRLYADLAAGVIELQRQPEEDTQ